jgi:hypothetical protein
VPGLASDPVHHFEVKISDFSHTLPNTEDKQKIEDLEAELARVNRQLLRLDMEHYGGTYQDSDGCGPGCG